MFTASSTYTTVSNRAHERDQGHELCIKRMAKWCVQAMTVSSQATQLYHDAMIALIGHKESVLTHSKSLRSTKLVHTRSVCATTRTYAVDEFMGGGRKVAGSSSFGWKR